MFKTIGVLAHVDAGKTTFSEQLLYQTKSIPSLGRVDNQTAFLDFNEIEQKRGITVFAEQGRFHIGDDTYNLIDTPGHIDFSLEMERSLKIMDYGIVIISAVEGIQGHTETILRLLAHYTIPTFIFINKTDRIGANIEKVMDDLHQIQEVNLFIDDLPFNESQTEQIVSQNEEALDKYFLGNWTYNDTVDEAKKLIKSRKLFICMAGSALQGKGINEFINTLHNLTETSYNIEDSFQAEVFKIRHVGNQKLTFMKALQGTVRAREEFEIGKTSEKMNEIRLYNGTDYQQVSSINAGDLFAVKGFSSFQIGDTLGHAIKTITNHANLELQPLLQAKVLYEGKLHQRELLKIFQMLEQEEPSLQVIWNETLEEIHIHFMGNIQIEVMRAILKNRFSLDVDFAAPSIIYKETIGNIVRGYGHFEPLKHYAEVHLELSPNERGRGITFSSICHTDALLPGHQRTIEHHLLSKNHNGLLTGSALTDIHITLLTGRAHEKHTAGGDFREAAYRALRQGLEQAENRLLEPYYSFTMRAELNLLGRMVTDIQKARGQFVDPVILDQSVIIKGTVPVATFLDYSTNFAAYTSGKGSLSLQPAGYYSCHNSDSVIEALQYNKNTDPDYSSSSIFCAKGKGYSIAWDKAKDAMHCETN